MVWKCHACGYSNYDEKRCKCYDCDEDRQDGEARSERTLKKKANETRVKSPTGVAASSGSKKAANETSVKSPTGVAVSSGSKTKRSGSMPTKIGVAGNSSGRSSLSIPSLSFTSTSTSSSSAKRRKLEPKGKKDKMQTSILQCFQPKPKKVTVQQEQRKRYLQQDCPDPASLITQRVTEVQFLRDSLSIVAESNIQPIRQLPLNEEQQRIAVAPPDVPLLVRAGAGTGKTHTMIRRSLHLATEYRMDPESILMVTFSNRASNEIKERIASAFASLCPEGERLRLPTIKTFHGLAYTWISRCWKACGLGKQLAILDTKTKQKKLMERAIEAHLDTLRLERCRRMLFGKSEQADDKSWDDILECVKVKHASEYSNAFSAADRRARELLPNEKKVTVEEMQAARVEMKTSRKLYLREECYLVLLRRKRNNASATCDLESRWSGDSYQCNLYLKLIENARKGNHGMNQYAEEDARVCEIYNKLQRETGQLDFYSLLIVFTEDVLGNKTLAHRFNEMYSHCIVDEYQDNSLEQAAMLAKIVNNGSLTVVGDDDQCIYSFRGASPGNFDRLKEFYSEERQITACEQTLVQNHRSSANILAVADVFLEKDRIRHQKVLKPTNAAGLPVEVWKVKRHVDQAKHIAEAIVERHEQQEVSYGEMAVLFRCSQMGEQFPALMSHVQKQLAKMNVPFHVVGGTTIFERETVLDALAYLRLCVGADDDSFTRVINKPPRQLPKDKVIPVIQEQANRSSMGSRVVSLQEAAEKLCDTGYGLSDSQHKALQMFMKKVGELNKKANYLDLPALLRYIWNDLGLGEWHQNKNSSNKKGDTKTKPSTNVKKAQAYVPLELNSLFQLAQHTVDEWRLREEAVIAHRLSSPGVPSLVDLSRKVVVPTIESIDLYDVPSHILDDIILAPLALGRSVVNEFLACAALQSYDIDDPESVSNKVSISTIHRAKGLEWCDVYIPYFNEKFLPTTYRADDNDSDEEADDSKDGTKKKKKFKRHVSGCEGHQGGRCNKKCAQYFRDLDDQRLGGTAEERHLNEERRLAHVAATRAKCKLVFTSFGPEISASQFMNDVRRLPESVIRVVNKDNDE